MDGVIGGDRRRPASLVAALTAGGDSRLAVDPRTGLNKYLCPPQPAPDLVCLSSCTASPIASRGFASAALAHAAIVGADSPAGRGQRLEKYRQTAAAALLAHFGVADIASATLYPSGTDAVLAAATCLAVEEQGRAMTAILPAASETGTGVPLAAACRPFDTLAGEVAPPSPHPVTTIHIPLRTEDGRPRDDDAVNAAYRAAAHAARDRPVVYLTHGTKTGLVAPVEPPEGVDVIVDACQARIAPEALAAYLRRGWPVAITGSKFFGGPAFSGALLMPKARGACADSVNLGTVLRWVAALDAMAAFRPMEREMAGYLRARAVVVERELARIPDAELIADLPPRGTGWADLPSIFTFAVRDPADRRRFLTADGLRPMYRGLAGEGVLLGQPVNLGPFGGLRLAFGARDLTAAAADLPHAFDVLRRVIGQLARTEILAAE